MRVFAGSLQGWSPWNNLTSPASGHSLASAAQQTPGPAVTCQAQLNSCSLQYPQLPAHVSACPCCAVLVLLCASVLGRVEGNAAEPAQPLICLLARCPLWVSAVQFYWHRSLSGS